MLLIGAGSAPLARAIAWLRRVPLPAQAAIVLAGCMLVFLWTPLTHQGYYSSTDILQGSELLKIAPPAYTSKNGVMADPVDQMIPFLAWSRDQLWAGRLPLWNPYSGWGAPQLANYQSAVFSPFSLPFYLLSMRAALVVAAFLKLWSLGYCTYLFLRSVAARHAAALAGAVAFMFSGYNVLWLSWPHVGAGVALPAGLYCVERALQAGAARPGRRGLALVGLTLALAAGLLAGHPETFFYAMLLLGAYTLFRLARSTKRWPDRMRRLGEFALAGGLAIGLAAAQLLPFAEYLAHSTVADARRADQKLFSLSPQLAALQAFPDLLGNPTLAYYDRALAKTMNYNEANSPYIGLAVLFLAGLAVLMLPRHRSPLVLFFTASGLLWLLYAYDVAGAATVLSRLPVFNLGAVSRSHIIWLFSVSCLAGLSVDCMLAPAPAIRPRSRRWPASAMLVAGAAIVWGLTLAGIAGDGAARLLEWAANQPGSAVASAAASAVRLPHVRFIAITYGIAVVCAAAIAAAGLVRPLGRYSALGAAAIVVLIFLQSGFLLKDYNPTIEARYFYPVSPALETISRQTGPAQTLRVDAALLPANSNMWYRLRSPSNYDAIGVRAYDRLHAQLMRSAAYLETARPATLSALQVMGIQYIATSRPYPFAARADRPPAPPADIRATDPLAPDRPISQMFTATAPGLAAISMPLAAFKRVNRCSLVATLEDVAAHALLARMPASCQDIQDNRAYVFSFPAQPHSQGRQYRLTLDSPDATPRSTLAAYYAAGAVPGEALSVGREMIAGRLIFEAYGITVAGLERIWSDGRVHLFRVPGSLPQYYAVPRAVVAGSDDEALGMLGRSDFDPATTVLIQGDLPAAAAGRPEKGRVEVLEETPAHIRLRVVRDTPGWLVALQTFYPGWVAHVNGRRQAIARANLAFSAVPVGLGVSEVVLDYDPASVRFGLIISALSVVALLAATALLVARRNERR